MSNYGYANVIVPIKVCQQIEAHAEAEMPNEGCGLLILKGNRVTDFIAADNRASGMVARGYFELYLRPPLTWDDIDVGKTGVAHSHPIDPSPSITDINGVGLWEGQPYLIYSTWTHSIAAYTIENGEVYWLPMFIEMSEPEKSSLKPKRWSRYM